MTAAGGQSHLGRVYGESFVAPAPSETQLSDNATPKVVWIGIPNLFIQGMDICWDQALNDKEYLSHFNPLYDGYLKIRDKAAAILDKLAVQRILLTGYRVAVMEYLKYQLEGKDRETQTIKEFNWGQGDYHSKVQVSVNDQFSPRRSSDVFDASVGSQRWGVRTKLHSLGRVHAPLIGSLIVELRLEKIENGMCVVTNIFVDPRSRSQD